MDIIFYGKVKNLLFYLLLVVLLLVVQFKYNDDEPDIMAFIPIVIIVFNKAYICWNYYKEIQNNNDITASIKDDNKSLDDVKNLDINDDDIPGDTKTSLKFLELYKDDLEDNEKNKKAYDVLYKFYPEMKDNDGLEKSTDKDRPENIYFQSRYGMLNYASYCDVKKKTEMENGHILMAMAWLWSQLCKTKEEDMKIQQFLGKYLPAHFIYGGFTRVIYKMLNDYFKSFDDIENNINNNNNESPTNDENVDGV